MANPRGEPFGRTALILYGSETGNAQDVAEELGRTCERLRFETQVAEMNDTDIRQLLRYDITIAVISTTGQGDLPANAQTFWRALRSVRLPPNCLRAAKFASFGLGDTSYPKFNWAHKKLHNRLLQLGAVPFYERGESDEQHPEGIDGTFLPWSLGLRQRLIDLFPLPDGQSVIADGVPLEPRWILDLVTDAKESAETVVPPSPTTTAPREASSESLPPDDLLEIANGVTATVESNTRLTPTKHWQDVRHLTLRLDDTRTYVPGDVLAIYPKNFPSDIDHFLDVMNWTSIADKPIRFVPNTLRSPHASGNSLHQHPPPVRFSSLDHAFSLRELLTNHLDIMSIPRRSLFAQLLHYTDDEFQRERLQEFTNPEYIDELFDYTTRPRRSILEVLDEFTSVKIPWQKVFSVIPLMRARQFSIASGGCLKADASCRSAGETPTKVELLIAIVKYRTVIKRIRQGVATRYIASLRKGQQITVTLAKGGLGFKTEDVRKPVIMVGPGTGVAPMRSLIYERIAAREKLGLPLAAGKEDDVLFYGCRNREADYFFESEWMKLAAQTGLIVFPAFSRDQRNKVYVQDLIRDQAKCVFHALSAREGLIYVCGSSGKMPQAVRQAVVDVFQQEGNMTREEAEASLARMEKDSRYKQETW